MTNVGCYTFDIDCDRDDCCAMGNYTGRTESDCIRQARRDGWRVGKMGTAEDGSRKASCHRHAKRASPVGTAGKVIDLMAALKESLRSPLVDTRNR